MKRGPVLKRRGQHCGCKPQLRFLFLDEQHQVLFGHPETAKSWQEAVALAILALPGIRRHVGDQCVHQPGPILVNGEWGCIRKSTGWATNCPETGRRRSKICKGDHHHVKTEGGVIKRAEIYSKRLVAAILGGSSKTLRGLKKSYSLLKRTMPFQTEDCTDAQKQP